MEEGHALNSKDEKSKWKHGISEWTHKIVKIQIKTITKTETNKQFKEETFRYVSVVFFFL